MATKIVIHSLFTSWLLSAVADLSKSATAYDIIQIDSVSFCMDNYLSPLQKDRPPKTHPIYGDFLSVFRLKITICGSRVSIKGFLQ